MTESNYEGTNRAKDILGKVDLLMANPDRDAQLDFGHVSWTRGRVNGQDAELQDMTFQINEINVRVISLGINIGSAEEPLLKVYEYKPLSHELVLKYFSHGFDAWLSEEDSSKLLDSFELQHKLGLTEPGLNDWGEFMDRLQKFISSPP